MNTPEWIEYTGSDEQIAALSNSKHGFVCRNNETDSGILSIKYGQLFSDQSEYPILNAMWKGSLKLFIDTNNTTHYLICQPHPLADLIKKWADTGCPVWVRPTKPYAFEVSDYENHPTTKLMVDHRGVYLITTAPDWNIPGEYRLTPFED